ncbi:MAG: hypothetical protein ACJ8F7_00125 [Gemmataceae bacterium]
MSASTDPHYLANYVLGRFGEPAFVRRARAVEEAYQVLLERCRRRRQELSRRLCAVTNSRPTAAVARRFNAAWDQFLHSLDLSQVNALRDGYNRYYLLEKECALRSAKLAEVGFRPLPPLTYADLAALFPPL